MKFQLYRKGQGALELAILVVFVLTAFTILFPCGSCSGKYESARSAACVNNLKQIHLVLSIYKNENGKRLPPIDDKVNNFIFESDALCPEYLADPEVLICPSNPDIDWNSNRPLPNRDCDCITDTDYIYLGWLVMRDKEAEILFEYYDSLLPEHRDADIAVEGETTTAGDSTLPRLTMPPLCRGFLLPPEELISGDKPGSSTIPIVWERPHTDPRRFRHRDSKTGKPGGHVLYKDGHVEFVAYGEKFPMTETMARLLEERPRAPIPNCEE